MTILLEPVCSTWIHEEVNAGFLQLVIDNSDEEAVYIGEKAHLCCIKKIYDNPRVQFVAINRFIDFNEVDSFREFFYYFRLLFSIIIKYKSDKLFVLCGYRPCLLAVELIAFLFRNIKIKFVLHGMVEEKKGNQKSYAKLFKLSECCKRLHFITYSPYCVGSLWGLRNDKFIFLNHPYVRSCPNTLSEKGNSGAKIIIGIIGACANDKAIKLISLVNKNKLVNEYEFWVLSQFGKKFKNLENTKVLDLEFERKNIEKLMCNMDYLLLPYGKDEYKLSASGVIWDAISNRIPCLMLNSRYFEYYMPYKIGYRSDCIKGLGNIICERIQDGGEKKDSFFVGMDRIEQENNRIMKSLLQ